jgi:hypothetical protein
VSFSLAAVRKYGPPLEQKVNELSQQLAKVQSENQEIETDDVVGFSDSDHSLIRYYDKLHFHKKFDTSVIGIVGPKVVFEPDYDKLVCWLRFSNLGWYLEDYSGFENRAEIFGEPCMTSGVDLGFYGGPMKSLAHETDNTGTISYRLAIDEFQTQQILEKTIGKSIFIRFNLASLAQQNSRDCTLYEKYDDIDNSISVRVDPTGVVKVFVRQAGVDYFSKTTVPVITINTDIDLMVTYNVTGNVRAIIVNGVSKAITTLVEVAGWDIGYKRAVIFACSLQDKGHCQGKPMDFRIYNEKVCTTAHALNLFTNKISISAAAFGEVAVVDGCIMPRFPIVPSFDVDSFSPTSFTT